jgi:hypothetical protein
MKKILPALVALVLTLPAHASSSLYVSSTGNVGIGTTAPAYTLDVLGGTTSSTEQLTSSSTDSTNLFLNNTTTGGQSWYVGTAGSANPLGEAVGDFHVGLTGTGSYLIIGTGGNISVPYNLGVTGTLSVTGAATLGNGSAAVTQSAGDSSTKIATDAFVNGTALTLANGTTATTQSSGDSSTDAATDAFVQTAVAGSSGMKLLATVNASAASSVVFNSTYITSTYNKYVIEYDGAFTSGGGLQLSMSVNNGSTYTAPTCFDNSRNSNYIGYYISGSMPTFGTSAGNSASATVKFTIGSSSIAQTMSVSDFAIGVTMNAGSGTVPMPNNECYANLSGAVNNVEIVPQGGGTITGNFHLYGLSGT